MQSVVWPPAQFAPLYLPPGSPSFMGYRYPRSGQRLSSLRPHFDSFVPNALGPYALNRARSGPSGDIARPPYLGGLAVMNPSIRRYRRYARKTNRADQVAEAAQIAFYRARLAQAKQNAGPPVIRQGPMPTNEMIPTGVPEPLGMVVGQMPDPIATARTNGLALQNALALQNGSWWESATTGEKVMAGIVALGGLVAVDRVFKLGLTGSVRPYAF